jgi:23S rRNA (uracil1939-C5)-methyltransferase
VTIEKLVYGGDGLGRLEGRVVLAPCVLPGERIRAAPVQEKPGLIRARPLEILAASPERISAACPYFGRCGGCHYQHAGYETQLAAKRAILSEVLRRVGKFDPPEDIVTVAGEPWLYRNRVQLHIEGSRIGYREADSHKLCAIDHCPISSPKINDVIRTLCEMHADPRWPRFVRSLEIFTDEQQVQLNVLETDQHVARRFFEWCAERIPGFVDGPLDYAGRYRVSGNSFFQVNRFLLDALVEAALHGASGETALELYAGVGLFTLQLASQFHAVSAVESSAAAVRDLQFNAERAVAGKIEAIRQTAEESLGSLTQAPDFVLLDPPRAGMGKVVVRRLTELMPAQISIVACDPATLARDLRVLLDAGYTIDRLTLIDLFPQTYHLETVVRLARR